ncbi:MAG: BamA/TamA family outer membrane protein, partial [Cycloclasticus sp.]|nr:BamA/TamA family outer membrane protein [Cycloclasticus sp.]
LSKLIPFKAGEPYLAGKVLTLKNNLKNAAYFREVEVDVLTDQRQNNEVKLRVSLSEELQYKYNAGLGFGTDTGARISLGWENKYFNSSGHRLSAAARLSQTGNTVTADYQIPLLSGLISDIGFSSEFKTEDTDSTQSSSFAIGSYYKANRWGWGETGSIKVLSESFDVSDDSSTSVLLIPSIGWTRTWADDSIYTKQGGKLSLSLSGASEALLSDVSFAQVVLRGKYIYSFNHSGRLITRANLGATEVSDFEKLPSSLRFFAGGDNSIRGFDFQSLGPLGDDGNVEGGRYLTTASVEYEHMFTDKWGAAVFSDVGNAYNSFNDPFEHSVGLGLRWRSPIGLIRFDVAKALSDSDNGIGFHLVIGPDL